MSPKGDAGSPCGRTWGLVVGLLYVVRRVAIAFGWSRRPARAGELGVGVAYAQGHQWLSGPQDGQKLCSGQPSPRTVYRLERDW